MSEELNSIRIQRAEYWPGIAHSSMTGVWRAGCVPHKFSTSPTVVLAYTKQTASQSLPFHGFDNTIEYIRKIPNLAAFIDRRITGGR
jgi:hypothetical protein